MQFIEEHDELHGIDFSIVSPECYDEFGVLIRDYVSTKNVLKRKIEQNAKIIILQKVLDNVVGKLWGVSYISLNGSAGSRDCVGFPLWMKNISFGL